MLAADVVDQISITGLLNDIVDSYSKKDVAQYLATMAKNYPVIVVGTNADEYLTDLATLETLLNRDMEQSKGVTCNVKELSSHVHGNVAWLGAKIDVKVEVEGGIWAIEGRFTGTALKADGIWKFVQTHFSVPQGGVPEGKSFGPPNVGC